MDIEIVNPVLCDESSSTSHYIVNRCFRWQWKIFLMLCVCYFHLVSFRAQKLQAQTFKTFKKIEQQLMAPQKWLKNINNNNKKERPLKTNYLQYIITCWVSDWDVWSENLSSAWKNLFSAIRVTKIHDIGLTADMHKGWLLVYTAAMICDWCVPSNMLSLQTAVWHDEVHVKSEKWAHARGHFRCRGRHYLSAPLSWLIRRGSEMWQRRHQMTAVGLYICLSAPELLYKTASAEQRCGTCKAKCEKAFR